MRINGTNWVRIFFLLLSPGLFLFCNSPSKQSPKAALIVRLIDSLYTAKIFNGAIVIGENDSIILTIGYGYSNFKDLSPLTPNTPCDGGSLAKTFTAAALWKLQKKGRLSLYDSVQKYLPGFPYPNTAIIDLITHNAGGIPEYDYFFPKIHDTAILTNGIMLGILSQEKPALLDPERKSFNYENCGYDLAALIIEKVTGKKYGDVLSEFFFGPLGMNATHVRPPRLSEWSFPRTIGYKWQHNSFAPHDIAEREGFYGGGNLNFTAMDLYKWGASFYNNKLNDDIVSEANRPGIISGKPTGLNQLNWYYTNGKKAFYYWGNVAGFYSHVYHDDEKKFTIAFMTNTTLPYNLRQPLAAALVEIMENGSYDKEHFALPASLPINDSGLLGTYRTSKGDSLRIFKGEKVLHIQRNNELRYNLFIVDSITAYAPGIDAWISISKEKDRLNLHWNSVFKKETAQRE